MFCSQNCEEKSDTASYCKIGKSQTRLNFRIIAYRFSFIAKLFYLHGLLSIKRSAHEIQTPFTCAFSGIRWLQTKG